MYRNKARRKIVTLQEEMKRVASKNYYHQIEDMQEIKEKIKKFQRLLK